MPGIQRLRQALIDPAHTVVVYESTGVYGKKLAHTLSPQVALVCEVNPKIIKNATLTMTQTKTDPGDAQAIAAVARHLYLVNRAVLTRYAVDTGRDPELAVWITEFDRLHKAIARLRQQIDAIVQLPGNAACQVEKRMRKELTQLQRSQKQVQEQIEKQADSEEIRLVAGIKGVGLLTAATVVNRIGTIQRFASADQLKAYLGIYPCLRQSGKSNGRARMAKHGDRLVRHQLFNCAKSAARFNPACRALFERLVQKGHSSLFAWIAVMRKLVQIIYGVLKNHTPWSPDFP